MKEQIFPDGTPMDPWFTQIPKPSLGDYEQIYRLDEEGILPGEKLQTREIQALIDRIAAQGGGLLYIPEGRFRSGALTLRQGVHLYLARGACLEGSEDIRDFPLCDTRIEGQNCCYFPALLNGEGLDGFVMFGEGTIDGNGKRFWDAFWLRRKWNPACTNKDEQRPRLFFLSHCRDVLVEGITFQNSPFWTNHLYQCERVKYLGCRMLSPARQAPSTDAIDIDACRDVLVKNCYMAVNDDAIALKGGKGPWADEAEENGANERILIEDCQYGFCHGCLTLGSESIHNRNIYMRDIQVETSFNMLWLKLRPDTPQHYEYIKVERVCGKAANFLNINPWSQFFDLQGRNDLPRSLCNNVTLKDCKFECDTFFNVRSDEAHYHLKDFTFQNLDILGANIDFYPEMMENPVQEGIHLTKKEGIDYEDSVTTIEEV